MAEDKREPTRALDKASRVVDALAAENGLSPADIADACDIPRSSVYRVLDGLVDVGWAVTDTDGNYSLSLDWLRLADAARTSYRMAACDCGHACHHRANRHDLIPQCGLRH